MIIVPIYLLLIFIFARYRKVNCFDEFIKGAKDGINVALQLLPTIVGLVFAIEVFTNSGIVNYIRLFFNNPLLVPELILQALLRPLSANSALVIMNNIYLKYNANSTVGQVSSLIQGCSDTTIYVVTVYFGSIAIRKTRYALAVGLLTDLITFTLAILLGFYFLT